jgi:hypothetical protein
MVEPQAAILVEPMDEDGVIEEAMAPQEVVDEVFTRTWAELKR